MSARGEHVWKEQTYRFFSPLVFCVRCGAQPHHPNGGSRCQPSADIKPAPHRGEVGGSAAPVTVPSATGAASLTESQEG